MSFPARRCFDFLVALLFAYEQEAFVAYDLLSANGILVNERIVDSMTLRSGDIVKVGKTLLRFIDPRSPVPDADAAETPKALDTPATKKNTLGRMIKKQRDLNICRLGLKNRLLTHEQIRRLLQKQAVEQGDKKDLPICSLPKAYCRRKNWKICCENITTQDTQQGCPFWQSGNRTKPDWQSRGGRMFGIARTLLQ